jgi:hypothetical protein
MTRLPLVAMLLLVVLVAAGCMGDSTSREDFEAQVRDARDRTDFALAHMTRATTYDELLERIEIAGVEADGAARELDDAGAPSDLRGQADELRDALRALSNELSATAEALSDEQFEGSNVQGLEFENWDRVQAALEDLREEGIDVPPLERHG